MEEFDIKNFGEALKEGIVVAIPVEPQFIAKQKHGNLKTNPRNTLQLNEQVRHEFRNPLQMQNLMTYYFDLGSERLETIYPYYHILEDSEVIHKRDKGTKSSKGSQATITNLGQRDYGRVEHKVIFKDGKGKTSYYQEYRKNVRGKRSALKKETFKVVNDDGVIEYREKVVGTKSSTVYINKHYHYIENNLENWLIGSLNTMFGLKRKRNQASDLLEGQYDFLINQFGV